MEREPWIECVDESIRDDVITVGGFIARTEDLADIETRWRETKRTFRLPLDAELKFSLPKGHPSRAVLDAHGLGQQTRIPIMLKAISEMSLHVIANTLIDHRPETAPLELPVYGLRLHIRHFEGVAVDPVVPTKGPEESTAMNPSQIIFHRRVRVLEHAAKTTVAEASRVFGVSRKTIHDWKRLGDAYGLEALMPKPRRRPQLPNQTPTWVVEELLAEAVVRPTLGAGRYADILAGRGFEISRSGVQKLLNRSGLGRRRQRVAALAQLTAATTGLVTEAALEGPFGFCHFAARPGDLVALDSFFIGKLKGVGPVWQLTAVDTATRWAIVEVFIGPSTAQIAARFVDKIIRKLSRLGVKVSGALTDNGPEFRGNAFSGHLADLGIVHHLTPPRSPNHNAVCERFQGTALQECWRPAFHRRRFDRLTQLRAEIDTWLVTYNTRRPNRSDFMRGRTPRQVLDTHRKKKAA